MKKQLLVLITLVNVNLTLQAQTNFSGTWDDPQLEMIDGIQYLNALPVKIIVSQTKDSIRIESTEAGESANVFTQTLALNGKTLERIGKTSKRTIRTTATWSSDKKALTIHTIYSYAEKPTEAEYTITERWQLIDGALVITKTSDAAVTDDWTIEGTYTKQ